MRKVRKGDEVVIMVGKDRGRRGRIMGVRADGRVYVEGLNKVKKHSKPNPMKNIKGGLVEKEAPIHISNVLLYDASTGKPDRVGFRTLANGKKVRYFKHSGEVVDRSGA